MAQPPSQHPGPPRGPQARRADLATGVIGVVFPLVGLLVGGLFALVGLAVGSVLVTLAGVAVAVLFVGIGYGVWRSRRPRVAKGLALSLESQAARRGERVAARLEIADPGGAAELVEVGLVCEVRYDLYERRSSGVGDHGTSGRATTVAKAYEEWVPASAAPHQTIALEVPRDAPYSHEGSCLSFTWRVVAREPARLRPDAQRRVDLWVWP